MSELDSGVRQVQVELYNKGTVHLFSAVVMPLQSIELLKHGVVRRHEYDTLPTRRSARYLVLQPANESGDQLVCILYTAEIDDFPSYETISYI